MNVLADGQSHTHIDSNRFYNLSHAICYSNGTNNDIRKSKHSIISPTCLHSFYRIAFEIMKIWVIFIEYLCSTGDNILHVQVSVDRKHSKTLLYSRLHCIACFLALVYADFSTSPVYLFYSIDQQINMTVCKDFCPRNGSRLAENQLLKQFY